MTSTKVLARTAGLLYLAVAIGGGFAESVRSGVRVADNPAATAANVIGHAGLFRLGFVADLIDFTCFLAVGLLLYTILKPVSARIALTMLVINAVSIPIQALNMLNQLAALLVATKPSYTAGLSVETSHSLVLLFLDLQHQGYLIAQIFFGLFLLPLGYLVYRSGFFPRLLGILLMIGSGGYVASIGATYAAPGFESSLSLYFGLVGGAAELLFLLWLLIKGATPPAEAQPKAAIQGAAA
jgi:hypothetical protein